MNTAKEQVRNILTSLPDNYSLEDVQYHLYVAEKIKKSLYRAEKEGMLSHKEVEEKLTKWTVDSEIDLIWAEESDARIEAYERGELETVSGTEVFSKYNKG